MNHFRIIPFEDGFVIHGDATDVHTTIAISKCLAERGQSLVPLIVTDPPFGKILDDDWDDFEGTDSEFATWMIGWTKVYRTFLEPNGAFYVWGGIGKVGYRPFLKYLGRVEYETELQIGDLITWKKKRAFGLANRYLFVREELLYLCNGNPKTPRCFQVPLLDQKRGYAGYNPKYPAKSEFLRRGNVWTDITEILRGKRHSAQKPVRLYEIPIEVHTKPEEWVIDPFAGSGTLAVAARKLRRRFIVVEKKEANVKLIEERLAETPIPPPPQRTLFDLAETS